MRFLFGVTCVFALCLAPLAGCSETSGDGGSGGSAGSGGTGGNGGSAGSGGAGGIGGNGGTGGTAGSGGDRGSGGAGGMAGSGGTGGTVGLCQDDLCECSEEGIRAAITEGGGPFTFDCDGPTTLVTGATIVIDKDVVLDGEGKLTVDGNTSHSVFWVEEATAELKGITITRGAAFSGGGIFSSSGRSDFPSFLTLTDCTVSGNTSEALGGGIHFSGFWGQGSLTLINTTVSQNVAQLQGGGIYSAVPLTLINSTVSENSAARDGGGIYASILQVTLVNSTVSGNTAEGPVEPNQGGGIFCDELTLISSTVSGNEADVGSGIYRLIDLTLKNSLIAGDCAGGVLETTSVGHNIESPGDTCGLDQTTDQPGKTPKQLNLGPLMGNGGPTETHALLPGSVAIDRIPEAECLDADGELLATDQRGIERPQGDACDVGAVEMEVTP